MIVQVPVGATDQYKEHLFNELFEAIAELLTKSRIATPSTAKWDKTPRTNDAMMINSQCCLLKKIARPRLTMLIGQKKPEECMG